ncbi:MAG: hypothetical protein IBJ17_19235 [Reyranella sp.]|nr:hypothetical protein [Reyranella sp.]
MDDVTIARAIHVLSVVHWFGGVAFVTTVVLPAIGRLAPPAARLPLFETIERRFAAQVRMSVPLAGFSGLYMVERLDLWSRLVDPAGWWLVGMIVVWVVFMVVLFVLEPLVLHDWFQRRATVDPVSVFVLMQRMHWVAVAAGFAAAGAAIFGAHGFLG